MYFDATTLIDDHPIKTVWHSIKSRLVKITNSISAGIVAYGTARADAELKRLKIYGKTGWDY
jgi:membrane carboxypeptidase/penicillin-binding protein|tara:strand:+ start:76 stop:261 length:186 start_codon:yes stop_codon:yes gene_type:complete